MGTIDIKYTTNTSANEIVDVLCAQCEGMGQHDIVVSLDRNGSESSEEQGWSVDWVDNYQVIRCRGCETVSFRRLQLVFGGCRSRWSRWHS